MKVVNAVYPEPEQAKAFFTGEEDGPMCMVNLLKFRDKAQYDEPGEPEMTGREAYDRYGSVMAPLVLAKGGKLRFSSRVDALVIGGGMANTFIAAQGIDVGKAVGRPNRQQDRIGGSVTESRLHRSTHRRLAHRIQVEPAERGLSIG